MSMKIKFKVQKAPDIVRKVNAWLELFGTPPFVGVTGSVVDENGYTAWVEDDPVIHVGRSTVKVDLGVEGTMTMSVAKNADRATYVLMDPRG